MMKNKILFGFLVATTWMTQALGQSIDISGIALGESLADARATAMKVNPAYKIENLIMNGATVGFKAIAGNTQRPEDAPDQLVAVADDSGKVWFIDRRQVYPEGKRIALDVLDKSLHDKFGEETSTLSRTHPT